MTRPAIHIFTKFADATTTNPLLRISQKSTYVGIWACSGQDEGLGHNRTPIIYVISGELSMYPPCACESGLVAMSAEKEFPETHIEEYAAFICVELNS